MKGVEGLALIISPAISKKVTDEEWNGFRDRGRVFNISMFCGSPLPDFVESPAAKN